MKIVQLYDLQREINHLFVAGSKFASNNPKLRKQSVIFGKMGDAVPVLKRIAAQLDELANADVADAPVKLLELGTLLYSVLYTQGETVESGKTMSKVFFEIDNDNSRLKQASKLTDKTQIAEPKCIYIRDLAQSPEENEAQIVKFANDRDASVRRLVYELMAEKTTPAFCRKLVEIFQKNKRKSDTEFVIEAMSRISLTEDADVLLLVVDKSFDEYKSVAYEPKKMRECLNKFSLYIKTLYGKVDEKIFVFFEKIFSDSQFLKACKLADGVKLKKFIDALSLNLATLPENAGYDCLENLSDITRKHNIPEVHNVFFCEYFRLSVAKLSRVALYNAFAPHVVILSNNGMFSELNRLPVSQIDSRWLPLFRRQFLKKANPDVEELKLVSRMSNPDDKDIQNFIAEAFLKETFFDGAFNYCAEFLINSGNKYAFAMVFDKICKLTVEKYFYIEGAKPYLKKFPRDYAEKFKQRAERLKNSNVYSSEVCRIIAGIIEDTNVDLNVKNI